MQARNLNLAFVAIGSLVALGLLTRNQVQAEAPPAEKASADKSRPSAAEIRQWIKDLDSDAFATRQTAAEMLYQAGKPAIAAIEQAAGGKSLEVTMQSVNVLRRQLQAADNETKQAAKDALDRLSKSQSPAAAPAKEAVAPPPAPPVNQNPRAIIRGFGGIGPGGFAPIGGNIQIQGGNIQIVPNGIPAGGLQVVRIQANLQGNGNRTTDVNENGKKIHIEEDQNGIEVKVTENVNGKDKTDTFKGKDADELKKKSPEAHKLYEKYMNGPGVGNIQIQALPFPGGLLPVAPQPQNTDAAKAASQQIAEAQKRIAEATENLRKNAGGAPNGEDLRRALDQLDQARKDLEGARGKLGG
jgi:hypothetical protein